MFSIGKTYKILFVINILILSTVYYIEYGMGVYACNLCKYQRIPYFLNLIILTFLIFIYLDYHLILSFFVSTLFFFGDLYFSFIKRKLNIKDFSKSLLGHGGILDRLDSMFFVFFLFYVTKL